jgi:serine/threonine-protein kinase
VALKLLPDGPLASEMDRARFSAEAAAGALLDHPHIVPVYEVGNQDGFHFLCMKLLAGGPLSARLPRFRRHPQAAARLVAAVADAVRHAHERGVLHRDLKPANILMEDAPDGPTPHVADFGLARREGHFGPGSAAVESLTHTGAILGTPAYMAPEQASGRRGAVTVATDIYGLGAVLYALLTGRPPFSGVDTFDVLRQVKECDPARPRSLNPTVPRDLETICLKCLRKEPERRYASARELADDLNRFLKGEPVQARPVGSLERLRRWAVRQPLVAGLASALLVAVAVGFVTVVLMWRAAESHRQEAEDRSRDANVERIRARNAAAEADAERGRAEEAAAENDRSFRQAHEAVNAMADLSREVNRVPGMQPLTKRLLETALVYNRDFVRRRSHDPALRRELAETHVQLAQITVLIGSRAEAAREYGEAARIYRELHQANPADPVLRRKLVMTVNSVGYSTDNLEQATVYYQESFDLCERFLREYGPNDDLESSWAVALNNLGSRNLVAGHMEPARQCFRRAAEIQRELVGRPGAPDSVYSELAGSYSNLATLALRQGEQMDDVLCLYECSRDLRRDLVNRSPRNPGHLAALAASHHEIGLALRDARRFGDAAEAFRDALAIRDQLAQAHPDVIRYQLDVCACHTSLSVLEERARHHDKALEGYELVRGLLERLEKRTPNDFTVRKELGLAHFRVGVVQGAMNHRPQELEAFLKARRYLEALVKEDPNNLEVRHDLGRTLSNIGHNYWATNRLREAVPVLHEAIRHQRLAHERAPTVPGYRNSLSRHYAALGEVERLQGHDAAALDAHLKRRALWPKDAFELYCTAVDVARIGEGMGKRPTALSAAEEELRERIAVEALQALRRGADAGYANAKQLRERSEFKWLSERTEFLEIEAAMKRSAEQSPP